jgi:hypothetical protein
MVLKRILELKREAVTGGLIKLLDVELDNLNSSTDIVIIVLFL